MINDDPFPAGTLYHLPVGQFVILSAHPYGTGGIQNNSKKLYGDILILFLEIYSHPVWGTNTAKVLVDGEVGYVSMKPGDIIKRTKTSRAGVRSSRSKIIGILLEEPQLPRWGNYPKKYRVLNQTGNVEIVSDEDRSVVEVLWA